MWYTYLVEGSNLLVNPVLLAFSLELLTLTFPVEPAPTTEIMLVTHIT